MDRMTFLASAFKLTDAIVYPAALVFPLINIFHIPPSPDKPRPRLLLLLLKPHPLRLTVSSLRPHVSSLRPHVSSLRPHVTAVMDENREHFALIHFTLSVCAATVAETVTYPLDLTKTRLQVQGEGGGVAKHGMLRVAFGVARDEGFLKLWQGVTPAIYRHIVYTGGRMTTYEQLREKVLCKNADGMFPLWKAIIAGMTSGAIGQFAASPADLVKVQMQTEGKRRLEGKSPRVRGAGHALRKILAEGGVRGLWAGWVPNVQRAALVNMGDLATYETMKRFLLQHTSLKDNWICHSLSSASAGLVAACLGTPADVVKTRIMNQPRNASSRGLCYHSSLHCLTNTMNDEGFWALYKGFIPTWTRMMRNLPQKPAVKHLPDLSYDDNGILHCASSHFSPPLEKAKQMAM
uniref:Solute carrier family 25 member 27 n=1 Tax=Eptatretus burgeri TaxID=7764 RepID=A0A8C4NJ55_EPTBU